MKRRRSSRSVLFAVCALAISELIAALGADAKSAGGAETREAMAQTVDTRAVLPVVLGDASARLSDVRWSHATNSASQLAKATSVSRPVDFVEADIVLEKDTGKPVMAHPPATTSDLSFEAFVERFVELALHPLGSTDGTASAARPLGLKLDFKDPRAVEPCLRILSAAVTKAGAAWRHPIWLNADLFTGPGGNPTKFNADEFLRQCQTAALPNVALSLGWTTGWNLLTCLGMHGYSAAHVDDALNALAKLQHPIAVTWAVRSTIIRQTPAAVVRRLTEKQRTLTVWGDAGSSELQWLASPDIAPHAFVDITSPALYLRATWFTQIAFPLLLASVLFYAFASHGNRIAKGFKP